VISNIFAVEATERGIVIIDITKRRSIYVLLLNGENRSHISFNIKE
jgi:hypothetical protein